jgi:penicillin-insensitive murein DD-endopeptidase
LQSVSTWRWLAAAALALSLVQAVAWGRWAASLPASALGSRSHGLSMAGGLSLGESMAPLGVDHRTFSTVDAALGRQYLHSDLADTLAAAFAEERKASLAKGRNASRWRVAETGWRGGGWFSPHLTHQAGLSVDIVTPLTEGRLPSWPWQELGYALDLDEEGGFGERTAEFDRLARLFDALCRQAPKHGLVARAFIVWGPWHPAIRGRMRSTCRSSLINAALPHDDHVHVTFTTMGRR